MWPRRESSRTRPRRIKRKANAYDVVKYGGPDENRTRI